MKTKTLVRTAGITLFAVVLAALLGTFLVRDQIKRSRRDLFSPHALRRLAALGYLSKAPPSVDAVLLLRDFIAWERRPMLRKRAAALLAQVEGGLDVRAGAGGRPEVA